MRTLNRIMVVALVIAALGVIMPGPADAQSFTTVRPGGRGGSWEFFLPLIYTESATINGQNGSSVDLNADWGMGFGFGYNFNENFQINGLFNWSSRSYDALVVNSDGTTRRYSNVLDTSNFSLNGVYYLLSGNITPFVTAGIGVTYVDTNIQNDPGATNCWTDPWYGYVCDYATTKTENDLSYNAGIGVRYDIKRQFGVQGSFNRTWIDFSKTSGTPGFDSWRVDFIFRM